MRRYGREKGRELTLPFFWETTSGVGNDLWGSLFRLPVGLAAASDERQLLYGISGGFWWKHFH